MNRIIRFIRRTLTTRVTPLAYLLAIEAIIYGLSFSVFSHTSGASLTVLYKSASFGGTPAWGMILLVAGIVLYAGMVLKNRFMTEMSALVAAMCWIFAGILYFELGLVFQLAVALVHLLCFGYCYLASSMNQLWDFAPSG